MERKRLCPKCDKPLRYRSTDRNYFCNNCRALFNEDMTEVNIEGIDLLRLSRDSNGNYYTTEEETKNNQVRYTKVYYLEPGKTTLRGDYPKLEPDSNCKYPERLSCNGEIGCSRCEFMEYGGSLGHWVCKYKKKN